MSSKIFEKFSDTLLKEIGYIQHLQIGIRTMVQEIHPSQNRRFPDTFDVQLCRLGRIDDLEAILREMSSFSEPSQFEGYPDDQKIMNKKMV